MHCFGSSENSRERPESTKVGRRERQQEDTMAGGAEVIAMQR